MIGSRERCALVALLKSMQMAYVMLHTAVHSSHTNPANPSAHGHLPAGSAFYVMGLYTGFKKIHVRQKTYLQV